MQRMNLEEAPAALKQLVGAALRGETILIVRDEDHIVQIVPITQPPKSRQAGSAKGRLTLAEDFDAPLADFAPYTS
ncbi:MAG: prevent-host-death protein [Chloroflexi bacterium CFX4]|nr:prevent-host-death protein [Chloroflexi bacterium CFX4]MDL1921158.1 prevent-host-death protein [Chloroflexi bacterium CFX3]